MSEDNVVPFNGRPSEEGSTKEAGSASGESAPSGGADSPRGDAVDQGVRDRISNSLDESLLVEAAAGTGKTTVLVERLVRVLATGSRGATTASVVAVTFTRKAAGELKLRLRERLEQERLASTDPDESRRLEEATAHLEEARIGTIHSFCAEILRERPIEAGIDPAFREVADGEDRELFARAFDEFIPERLVDLPEGVRRALERLTLEGGSRFGAPLERLRDAAWNLVEWRDYPGDWRREPFERAWAIDKLLERVLRLADLIEPAPRRDILVSDLQPVTLLANWIRRPSLHHPSDQESPRDDDALEARLVALCRDLSGWNRPRKGSGPLAEGIARQQVIELKDGLIEALERFRDCVDADLAVALRADLWPVVANYDGVKRRSGRLDFQDLLILTRDLVRDRADVRRHLQRRITHIFVDEFQDTDPLQAEILFLLAGEEEALATGEAAEAEPPDWRQVKPAPGKLFLVGDPKQSIYRFRRADVRLYQEIERDLREAGVAVLHLTQSFRSVPDIQRVINHAFAEVMDGSQDIGNPAYVPLHESRPAIADQPSVIVLPAPRPYGVRRIAESAINDCYPETTAAFVAWLLERDDSGATAFKVRDPRRGVIDIEPRHICLLFRRFVSWGNDVVRPYVRAFDRLSIPHLLVGSRSFFEREEVETLRAALSAIEWPDDELSVYATLRGALFGITDDELLRFRQAVPEGKRPVACIRSMRFRSMPTTPSTLTCCRFMTRYSCSVRCIGSAIVERSSRRCRRS